LLEALDDVLRQILAHGALEKIFLVQHLHLEFRVHSVGILDDAVIEKREPPSTELAISMRSPCEHSKYPAISDFTSMYWAR